MADEFSKDERHFREGSEHSGEENNDCEEQSDNFEASDDAKDQSLEDMYDSLQEDYDEQEKLLIEARRERDTLRIDIGQLRRQFVQQLTEVKSFKSQISTLKDGRNQLRGQYSDLSRQSKSQKADLERMQKEKADLDLALCSLKKKTARLETEVSELKEKNKATSNYRSPTVEDVEDEDLAFRGATKDLSESDPVLLPDPAFNLHQTIVETTKVQNSSPSNQEGNEQHTKILESKPAPTTKKSQKPETKIDFSQLSTEYRISLQMARREKIEQLERAADEGRARESALQKQVKDLSAKLALEIEQKKFWQDHVKLDQKYCPARLNRRGLEKAAKNLERENRELAEQIQQKDIASYNQHKIISQLQERNWQSESFKELEKKRDENSQLMKEIKYLQSSLDRKTKQAQLDVTELNEKLASTRQAHDDLKKAFKDRLAEKQKETRNLRTELQTRTSEIEKGNSEANELRSQLRIARTEVAMLGYERDMVAKKMRAMGAIFEYLSEPNSTVFMLRNENRHLKHQLKAKDSSPPAANTQISKVTSKACSPVIAQHIHDVAEKVKTIKQQTAELDDKTMIASRKENDVTSLYDKLVESDSKLAKSEGKLASVLANVAAVRTDIAGKVSKLQESNAQSEILLLLDRLPPKEKKNKRHRFHKNQIKGFRLRAEAEAAISVVQGALQREEQTASDDSDAAEMITSNDGLPNQHKLDVPNTTDVGNDTLVLSCAETMAFTNSLATRGLVFVSRDELAQCLSGTYASEVDGAINVYTTSLPVGESKGEDTTNEISSLHAFTRRLCFGFILLCLASVFCTISRCFPQEIPQSASDEVDILPVKLGLTAELARNSSITTIDASQEAAQQPLTISVKLTATENQNPPDVLNYDVSASQIGFNVFGNMCTNPQISPVNAPEPKSRPDKLTESHDEANAAKATEVVPVSTIALENSHVAQKSTVMIAESSIYPKPSTKNYTVSNARWRTNLFEFGMTVNDKLGIEIAGMFSVIAIFFVWLIQ